MSANIAIFVPHAGCRHRCSFCNQNSITGGTVMPRAADVESAALCAVAGLKEHSQAEIAFFGGSFTAIPQDYMNELLNAAYRFVEDGSFKGIRISTRPDCIDGEILSLLKKKGVTAIELGAQSMDDGVLIENGRGHTARDVETASALIKESGFELGLQMMTGLYKSSREKDIHTAEKLAALEPETVRIYPAVVLPKTALAELFEKGEYTPQGLDEAVELCAELLLFFKEKNIKVIKLGLHSSDEVGNGFLAGPYHPAFRELCENKIYYGAARAAIENAGIKAGSEVTLLVKKGCVSKMAGQKKSNISKLREDGYFCRVAEDGNIGLYEVRV